MACTTISAFGRLDDEDSPVEGVEFEYDAIMVDGDSVYGIITEGDEVPVNEEGFAVDADGDEISDLDEFPRVELFRFDPNSGGWLQVEHAVDARALLFEQLIISS